MFPLHKHSDQSAISPRDLYPHHADFHILGSLFKPGAKVDLCLLTGLAEIQGSMVHIINGTQPGPILCLTAALHGDELNGVEVVRQILTGIDAEKLCGTVVAIPVVNISGYITGVRSMGDASDLNRCFSKALPTGSGSHYANFLMEQIISHCDALIDIHTGSILRENYTQLRADLSAHGVANLAESCGSLSILQNKARIGTLREAATRIGIPAVVMEVGGSMKIDLKMVGKGVEGIRDLLDISGMTHDGRELKGEQHLYLGSGWITSEWPGMLINSVELGTEVEAGDLLAEIIDPFTHEKHSVYAPFPCTILSRAYDRHVDSGFWLFRVGIL